MILKGSCLYVDSNPGSCLYVDSNPGSCLYVDSHPGSCFLQVKWPVPNCICRCKSDYHAIAAMAVYDKT